jgi:hypothetical protein
MKLQRNFHLCYSVLNCEKGRRPLRHLLVFLLLCGFAISEEKGATTTRVVLVNSNIPSGAILKGMREHCKSMTLTLDPSQATYSLEAQISRESEAKDERSWLTLFNKQGDAVFETQTHGTGNAVKDVCNFLQLGER